MTALDKPLSLFLARVLSGGLFLYAGIGKLPDVPGFAAYLETGGLPGELAWPAVALEIALGLGLILGIRTRVLALIGAGFCCATAFLYHVDPDNYVQTIQLGKNLAIAGGFLLLASHGPGRFALTRG